MMGRTHVVVGMATGVIAMNPFTIKDLCFGLGVSAIGSVLPDIDCGTSKSHVGLIKILAIQLFIVMLVVFLDKFFQLGIYNSLIKNRNTTMMLCVVFFFLFLCLIGMITRHRTFMHSIVGFALFSGSLYILVPNYINYFMLSFASHIFLDLFNEQKIELFYPKKIFRLSFNMFPSDGKVNWLMFVIGFAFLIWGVAHSVAHICGMPDMNKINQSPVTIDCRDVRF